MNNRQLVAVCATYPAMRSNLARWLAKALKHADDMPQAELARKLSEEIGRKIDRAAVNKMLKATGKQKPRYIKADELVAISRITGFPAPVDKRTRGRTINIVGDIGAGEQIFAFDDEAMGGGDPIDAPPDLGPDAVGLRVRGMSMYPEYEDGDVIAYDERLESFDHLIGRRLIVGLPDGRRYIKRLHRGSADGLYTLRSANPREPDIVDVAVEWVARIRWVRPAQ